MLVMVVMLMVGGAVGEEHVHPVRDCFNNREQILLRGFFAAREVYDQRLSTDPRRTAAQAAARRDLKTCPAHGLRNAARLALDDGKCGLPRDVTL